jgi:catechol 2,3-dioxygenase-like lactoylglutathione lyase family enzyme
MLNGVSHVGFTVADLERAAGFYQKLFGRAPEVRQTFDAPYTAEQVGYRGARLDIAIFRIPGSDVRLELIQYLSPHGRPVETETSNPGTAHLCLFADDVAAEFQRLASLGALPRSQSPVRITSGPNQGKLVAYFRDPHDSITIEIMQAGVAGA